MAYFTKMTSSTKDKSKKNVVIMGRKTWESIPLKYKPLANRINIILSSLDLNVKKYNEVYSVKSLDGVVNLLQEELTNQYETIWVVGGAKVYEVNIVHRSVNFSSW